MLRLEADPAEVIDDDGGERLARDDHSDQGRGPEPGSGHDRAGHVERAESAAEPDPPRCVTESAQGRQRLEDERSGRREDDRAGQERDEGGPHRAVQPVRELRVDAELQRQCGAGSEREKEVRPHHCAIRFRGGMLVPLPATGEDRCSASA